MIKESHDMPRQYPPTSLTYAHLLSSPLVHRLIPEEDLVEQRIRRVRLLRRDVRVDGQGGDGTKKVPKLVEGLT